MNNMNENNNNNTKLNNSVNKPIKPAETGLDNVAKGFAKVAGENFEQPDYDDYDPNWKKENDKFYQDFDKRITKAGYPQEEIDKVVGIGKSYAKNPKTSKGFIGYDQMDELSNQMGLSGLSDPELRKSWDKYYDILNRESYNGGSMKKWDDYRDAASAIAEVINREAGNRRKSGNYFPYDENDINEAKEKIRGIIKPHEGYDADSFEGYLTGDEGKQIRDLANEYRLSDEDLAGISRLFGPGFYSGYGYKK